MKKLEDIWFKLTARYTDSTDLIEKLWSEIKESYSEKKRHYHNLTHLADMIEKAVLYKERLNDFDTVMLSIFYHDIIYNVKRRNNEKKSAEFATNRLTQLGIESKQISRCHDQILATTHQLAETQTVYDDPDTNFLVDFDLAILGESSKLYEDYAQKIRKEYSIYPNFLYKKGRKKVLHHFLGMEHIFKTKEFQDLYEQQARENLKAELELL